MARKFLVLAAALVATSTLLAPAAQACISCEYVPEVTRTPVKGQKAAARASRKHVRVAATPRQAGRSKQRLAKAPVQKVPAQKIEARKAPVQKVAEAKAAPAHVEPVAAENKPISTAALLETKGVQGASNEETEVAGADVGCKKFFPTVGKTMTVPCE